MTNLKGRCPITGVGGMSLLLLFCHTAKSTACECPQVDPPLTRGQELQWSQAQSSIVFVGTLVSLEPLGPEYKDDPIVLQGGAVIPRRYSLNPGYRMSFRVHDVWKGKPGKTTLVSTGPGSCAYTPEHGVGERHLIFARKRTHGGHEQVWTDVCLGSESSPNVSDVITALGRPHRHYEE